MTSEIIKQVSEVRFLLADLHKREIDGMGKYLGNMDSRGQISSEGNYHNGVAAGLKIALNLVYSIKLPAEPPAESSVVKDPAPEPQKPSRRADWHYASQGYCDNPGRGY